MSGYSASNDPVPTGEQGDQAQAGSASVPPSNPVPPASTASLLRIEDARFILECLARGQTDDAIARSLGISTRTLNRRMARMMDALGAQTRFQLGIRITPELRDALRSWADEAIDLGEVTSTRTRNADRLRRQLERRGQPVQALVWLWLDPDSPTDGPGTSSQAPPDAGGARRAQGAAS